MNQVEQGAAAKIPSRQIGDSVRRTPEGIVTTVSEGAKSQGEKPKGTGPTTGEPAKGAWGHARDGAVGVGRGVKDFFPHPFSN